MPARQAVISLPIEQVAELERFDAVEQLSELFVIHADVMCAEPVDFSSALGKAAQITITQDSESQRSFSGLMFEVEFIDETPAGYRYRLTLRPWLYALTRNLDFVIFQNLSAVKIIEKVFDTRGCSDVDFSQLKHESTYATRDYCVQYRESDFDFVSRLMEEEGIYYFFEHRGGRHFLVLCDDPNSHKDSEYDSLPYLPFGQSLLADRVWRWTEHVSTGSEGKVTYRGFDFKTPTMKVENTDNIAAEAGAAAGAADQGARLVANAGAVAGSAADAKKVEVYDFPGTFVDNGRATALAAAVARAAQSFKQAYHGEGDGVWLAVGTKVTIKSHPLDRLNQSYLVTSLHYRVEAMGFVSGGAGAGDQPVVVAVTATPAATRFHAPSRTRRPTARGPETAMVVGPAGETIYTDSFGRVKVRFHWDRGPDSPDPTCWIRVAWSSADGGFGHVVLPRIGQEVLVDFVNGNPDEPIIVGGVYNGDKKQPYGLPDDKTRSVWRSHTINGGADDFNEISFEDINGSEEIKVQAQKDRNTLVKHDDTLTVKNNLTTTVQEGDEKRDVSKGKRTTTVQMDDSLTVNQGNNNITVSAGNMTTDVASGDYSLKVDSGQVTVEAAKKITLKVGSSTIVIDTTSITLNAIVITSKAVADHNIKGAITNISGSAMTSISGGIVKIN